MTLRLALIMLLCMDINAKHKKKKKKETGDLLPQHKTTPKMKPFYKERGEEGGGRSLKGRKTKKNKI